MARCRGEHTVKPLTAEREPAAGDFQSLRTIQILCMHAFKSQLSILKSSLAHPFPIRPAPVSDICRAEPEDNSVIGRLDGNVRIMEFHVVEDIHHNI